MKQKEILKNTIIIGFITQFSRILGVMRELLMIRILGVGLFSDAFLTAYKVPTFLRKIFAEGALSAAFVPHISHSVALYGPTSATGLVSLTFLLFESTCFIVTLISIFFSHQIIQLIAPGFNAIQINFGAQCLTILMPFVLFISSSSLLASALQAAHHFIIPALMPVILNIFFIGALFFCLWFNFSITFVCWGVVFGSFFQFLMHLYAYFKYNFRFGRWNTQDISTTKTVITNFLICLPTISFSEINLFIDTSFASTLPEGSVSLLYYANRFMGIPLGVLIGSFATVLLPNLTRTAQKGRRRLSFFLFHAIKFVLWVTIPIALIMGYTSFELFKTLFMSNKFSLAQAQESAHILQGFLAGLMFLSINRIFLNTFYALKSSIIPAFVSLCAVFINITGNFFLLKAWGSVGLALATTLSAATQTLLFLFILNKKYKINMYLPQLLIFLRRYCIQLAVIGLPIIGIHQLIKYAITSYTSEYFYVFLLEKMGFWIWTAPLCGVYCILLWWSRTRFNIRIFFIE
jgi:putative peptidoglycan lipid II flippase